MSPLKITGNTLGERHKNYNKAIEDIIKKNHSFDKLKTEPDVTDYDHLMKIDIASLQKNEEYILNILKSNDMLHVSRALKKSVWLITDPKYSHIINPEYLYNELLPTMTGKAGCKLMLHIRLNLKDSARVEEFFKYYEERDIHTALKWLQHCSVPVIEVAVKKHLNHINDTLFRRLCQKSLSIFEACSDEVCTSQLKAVVFLLKNNIDSFLKIMEQRKIHQWSRPKLGVRHTDTIMKHKKQYVMDNFDKLYNNIKMKTFVKHLTEEEVKSFLIKQSRNENLRGWFNQSNLAPFIEKLPTEAKFKFVKDLFINKTMSTPAPVGRVQCRQRCSFSIETKMCRRNIRPKSKQYQWYKYAKFEEAFPELKKMIQAESSPEERTNILKVLIECASGNKNNVKTILIYLREKHMNEPFIHKIQFVNYFATRNNAFKFNDEMWSILDTLFHSLDVYTDPKNNVQTCIENIILRNVINNVTINEVIESKFVFNTLINYRKKLSDDEQEKIFLYLISYLGNKDDGKKPNTDEDSKTYIDNMIKLFSDWDKQITDYDEVLLNTIKQYIKLHNKSMLSIFLLFKNKKTWRKELFEESVMISPSSETFINALKHDPGLLSRYEGQVDAFIFDDNNMVKRVLRKIDIYWPESLRQEWIVKYQKRLNPSSSSKNDIATDKTYKVIVNGLFMLLSAENSLKMVLENAPTENKIVWEEVDRNKLALQKAIATCMHVTRPQLSPEAAIMYAKGDYFQFVLPSLIALLHNTSKKDSRDYIISLLDKPVSVQKHALRFAFYKMNLQELQDIFEKVWNNSKNSTIRTVIFELTLKLMCKERNNDKIEELWKLVKMFINKLTDGENKNVYILLSKVDDVPDSIKGRYFVISYNFLKSLPAKADCESLLQKMENYLSKIVQKVDDAFLENYILEDIDKIYVKKTKSPFHINQNVIVNYVLQAPNAEKQMINFNKAVLPLLKHIFPAKSDTYKFEHKIYLNNILQTFGHKYYTKQNRIPVNVFNEIQKQLDENLPIEDKYTIGYEWIFLTAFVESMDEEKSFTDWKNHTLQIIPSFVKKVMNLLKTEYDKHHEKIRSIQKILGSALKHMMMRFESNINLKICKEMLDSSQEPFIFMIVIDIMAHVYGDDKEQVNQRNNMILRIYDHLDFEVKVRCIQKFKKLPEINNEKNLEDSESDSDSD